MWTRRWFRAVLLTGALAAGALAACSTATTEGASATTTAPATPAQTTTGPEPVTPAEAAWIRCVTKLEKRLEKTALRGGVVTPSLMLSQAKAFAACRKGSVRCRARASSGLLRWPRARAASSARLRNSCVLRPPTWTRAGRSRQAPPPRATSTGPSRGLRLHGQRRQPPLRCGG
jgi:hypothetical protein